MSNGWRKYSLVGFITGSRTDCVEVEELGVVWLEVAMIAKTRMQKNEKEGKKGWRSRSRKDQNESDIMLQPSN